MPDQTPTAERDAPREGQFCDRHFSWLCQAGQGRCQTPQQITANLRESFLHSDSLDPAWIAGWHAAIDHATSALTRVIPPGATTQGDTHA